MGEGAESLEAPPNGRCSFCNSKASTVCRLCGRAACTRHVKGGLCVACSEALCMLCGGRLSIARCAACGRLVCVECSVQLDPVRRMCAECVKRGARPLAGPPPRGAAHLALRVIPSKRSRGIS